MYVTHTTGSGFSTLLHTAQWSLHTQSSDLCKVRLRGGGRFRTVYKDCITDAALHVHLVWYHCRCRVVEVEVLALATLTPPPALQTSCVRRTSDGVSVGSLHLPGPKITYSAAYEEAAAADRASPCTPEGYHTALRPLTGAANGRWGARARTLKPRSRVAFDCE